MSFSPFESPGQNPYRQSTQTWPAETPQSGSGSTTQFTILGIVFILLSILGLAMMVLYAIGQVNEMSRVPVGPPANANDAERFGFYIGYWGSIVIVALSGLLQPLVAWAGVNMIRRQGLGIAKLGAIVLCIPCLTSCCFLGLPFGIWGIIALNSESAKQLFR